MQPQFFDRETYLVILSYKELCHMWLKEIFRYKNIFTCMVSLGAGVIAGHIQKQTKYIFI